ncbi:Disease resistance protein RUN1 [Linum perenne]
MASSSSATRDWKFDVFICFHGEDTRKEFTSHLHKALEDKSYIMTFIDEKLEKTKSIDELLTILEKSAISVVIFSPNFAKSTWCLDEVATIAQSMDNFGHRVLPVFYKVEPSDVSGDPCCIYATDIDGLPESEKKKEEWKNALKLVCNRSGRTLAETKKDSELVELIVGNVQKIVEDLYPRVKDKEWVDMDARILQVEQLLAMDENNVTDVLVVGLWGMGGSGKSALAKACYEKLTVPSSSTEGISHCFVERINEKYEEQHGVGGLIKEVYSQLLPGDSINHHHEINNGSKRARLRQSKVFLVLDDIGTRKQLNELLLGNWFNPTKVFGKGSRIIVTTRDKTVLIAGGDHVKIHPVESWHDAESLELFSLCAFQQPNPPDGWMDLSNRAVSYCNGNPLAIEVLGGTLCGMDKKYWVDFLSNLTHRQDLPGVHEILRKSYYKLKENQQKVFLNVACFLYGMLESRVIYCMEDDDYRPRCDVTDLINKSLLVCVASNDGLVIEVHDLLKDMAWIIVNEERDLNKRTMLEDPQKINKLLQTVEQDRATQGISLNLLKAKRMNLEPNAFSGMKYLEWIKFYHPQLWECWRRKINIQSGNIDLPSELRVLQWDNYPLVSLPSGFSPQNLRILCLRNNSIVKCWEGECQSQEMVKLVELDLSGCIYLTAVPDLSKSTRLEVLILRYCRSLVELPSYVGNLENLVRLDVKDCLQLHNIPTQLNSKVLKYVLMSKCENLTCCPEISNSTKLEVLDLENTPIYEPPPASTYNRVQNGGTLRLNCEKITSFPTLSSTLSELSLCNTSIREIDFSPPHSPGFESLTQPRFQQLELNYNLVLKSLPDNIWEMVSTDIFVRNCPLLETLPNISGSVQNGLTRLIVTDCKCLKRVPSSISNLKHLQVLFLINLPITALPSSVGELSQLSTLDLFGCTSLESIPDTIYNLSKLHVLTVGGCRKLVYLPRLPPSLLYLTAARCKLLRDLPSNLQELSCKEIWLDRCSQVDRGSIAIMVTNVLDQSMALHAKVLDYYYFCTKNK